MRHGLRSPLYVIAGTAELLLASELDPAQRELVEDLVAATRALRAQIETLLDPGATLDDPWSDGAEPTGTLRGRVLVVDDEAVNRRVGAALLRSLGLDVEIADGGAAAARAAAARAAEARPFDLVLTDVQMPGVDGVALTRRIRAIDRAEGRDTIVIGLTAGASAADRRRCLDAGMDDYLAKPTSRRALAEHIAGWLSAPDGEGAVTSSGTMRRDERIERLREPALDPATLDELRALTGEVGGDAMRELYELYLDDLGTRMVALREAFAAGDGEALARAAHAICGSSGSIGARHLSELCRTLERSVDVREQSALVERIEAESARVVEAIRSELGDAIAQAV